MLATLAKNQLTLQGTGHSSQFVPLHLCPLSQLHGAVSSVADLVLNRNYNSNTRSFSQTTSKGCQMQTTYLFVSQEACPAKTYEAALLYAKQSKKNSSNSPK